MGFKVFDKLKIADLLVYTWVLSFLANNVRFRCYTNWFFKAFLEAFSDINTTKHVGFNGFNKLNIAGLLVYTWVLSFF